MTLIWSGAAGEYGGFADSSAKLDSDGGGSKPGSVFSPMGELNVGDGGAAVAGDDGKGMSESSENEGCGGTESESD
jgi:hypothetical protein